MAEPVRVPVVLLSAYALFYARSAPLAALCTAALCGIGVHRARGNSGYIEAALLLANALAGLGAAAGGWALLGRPLDGLLALDTRALLRKARSADIARAILALVLVTLAYVSTELLGYHVDNRWRLLALALLCMLFAAAYLADARGGDEYRLASHARDHLLVAGASAAAVLADVAARNTLAQNGVLGAAVLVWLGMRHGDVWRAMNLFS